MRIMHIAPSATYNEGWSYQENLLPKYQQQLGHDVCLVVTNREHRGGQTVEVECSDKIESDGFRVIRRNVQPTIVKPLTNFLSIIDVWSLLVDYKPDMVFYHGLGTSTMKQVIQYKRKLAPQLVIVQDNHLDYNIGFNPYTAKGRVLRYITRSLQKPYNKYVSRFYGVTPWRKKYAIEVFGTPADRTDVLIMGADDEKIKYSQREEIRQGIRKKYGISDDEFLIVTGGRLDKRKRTHLLMQAVNQVKGVKLIVFGNVLEDIKEEFDSQLSEQVQWIGFISADDSYDYFLAADLVVFPGQHSVLWEQACACKTPCVFGRWDGMDHVNNGGNADFLEDVSVEGLVKMICELRWTEKYETMKQAALSDLTDVFLYSGIARKSLETMHDCEALKYTTKKENT